MTNVALTYSALGRHEEALVLYEAVLEFRLRVLPEGHPHIGEWHSSAWFFCVVRCLVCYLADVAGETMNNLALTYSNLGRHEDALAFIQTAINILRRELPDDHPNLGEIIVALIALLY